MIEDKIQAAHDFLVKVVGVDPASTEDTRDTPRRIVKAWEFWTQGYRQNPAEVLKTFEEAAENYNELVLLRDLPVYSMCAHHLTPFFGVAHIGYIPDGKVVGLSKLSRLVDIFARRLQVQEQLTCQIADALCEHLRPRGVGVVIECRHLCMESRGVQRQGQVTITSALRGVLIQDTDARIEFMQLIRLKPSVAVAKGAVCAEVIAAACFYSRVKSEKCLSTGGY